MSNSSEQILEDPVSNAIGAKQRLNSYNSVSSGTRLLVVLYRVEVEHLSVFRTLRILKMLYYLLCNVPRSLAQTSASAAGSADLE